MADPASENERLRNQIEEYRQRELADLRQLLADARAEASHFRTEAERNASIGRQIAAQYQEQVTKLKMQLEAVREVKNERPRFSRS